MIQITSRGVGPTEFLFLLQGLKWTLLLSLIALVSGSVGGLVIAIARVSPFRILRGLAIAFIEVFQGTPLLLQLFVVYYGTAILNVPIDPWLAVSIGLFLNASALLGEIWRSCIQAIPQGQWEAGESLGIRYFGRLRFIILPQAFRISLPPTVGFLVQLIKGTSLAALVGFAELTRAGQMISNATFKPLLVYGIVGIMYFVVCWPLSIWSGRLEERLVIPHR
jgi:polar amino acid transport system permease protein